LAFYRSGWLSDRINGAAFHRIRYLAFRTRFAGLSLRRKTIHGLGGHPITLTARRQRMKNSAELSLGETVTIMLFKLDEREGQALLPFFGHRRTLSRQATADPFQQLKHSVSRLTS